MLKKFSVFLVIILIYCCKENIPVKSDNLIIAKNNNLNNESFIDYLPTSTTNKIIRHEFYTLSYNEKYEQAEWVAYELKENMIVKNNFERPYFIEDPLVGTNSADWRNYKKSGFDKGHHCPAGDMKFSKKAFEDTFFTSNISPQKHNFNAGIWNRLEEKTRYWAQKYQSIYVITGSLLNDNLATIGKENVAVPEYYYKILLYKNNDKYKIIAFLMPSQESKLPLYEFVKSTDEIEKLSGIDFFAKLPDQIESKLEKSSDYKEWSF